MTNIAESPFLRTFQVIRGDGPVTNTLGTIKQPSPLPAFDAEGVVQPAKAEDIKVVPELERTKEMLKIYTGGKLLVSSVEAQTIADLVTYRGEQWKVVSCKTWTGTALDHYKVILSKVGKG